jgi:DNA-binding NtrC family response regulator
MHHVSVPAMEYAMPPETRHDKSGAMPVSLNGVSVLLVEDTWHVAQAVKSVLETCGMDIVGPAATIANAELLLGQRVPDMAVVDINLRGEMSYGLIDQLHRQGIPVVVVSGYEVLPMLDGKVIATLIKPIRAGALLGILRELAKQLGAKQRAVTVPGAAKPQPEP